MQSPQVLSVIPFNHSIASSGSSDRSGSSPDRAADKPTEVRYMTIIQPAGRVTYRNLSHYTAKAYVEQFNETWSDQGLYAIMVPEKSVRLDKDDHEQDSSPRRAAG